MPPCRRFTRTPSYGITVVPETVYGYCIAIGCFVRDDRVFRARLRVFSVFQGRSERIRRRVRDRELDQVERTILHTAHRVMIGNERMDERATARSGK